MMLVQVTKCNCGLGNEFFFSLTQNVTYYLKVASRSNLTGSSSFRIQAIAPNLNDECGNATSLTIQTGSITSVNYNNSGSTIGAQASCDNVSQEYLDSWYALTMPVNGNIRITGAYGNDTFSLYSDCAGTELYCGPGSETFLDLTIGVTYYLRVASRSNLIANRSFGIQTFEKTINDECAMSINIPIETANSVSTQYNNGGSTVSLQSSCENVNFQYLDSWYAFTMPVDGNVRLTGASGNEYFALFDACAGTEIQCGTGSEYYYGLTQGTSYTLRVASRSDLIATRQFNLQAFEPLSNDECANATNIAIETDNPVNISYNNAGSTAGAQASCENTNFNYPDSWYTFTMPVTGNVRITGAYGNDTFSLFDACSGNELQCGFGAEFYYTLTQGTVYTLRVGSREDLIGIRAFSIQAFFPPVNNECVDATLLTIATANAITVNYNNQGSTSSATQASCENTNFNYPDQWYTFNMPVTGNVEISSAYGNDIFTLYDVCNGTEIQCGFGAENYLNLTENTDYTLRVSSREDLASTRSFNIQAFGSVSNDECSMAEAIAIQTTSEVSVAYNTASATQSTATACESTSFVWQDLWYQFNMPVNGNVYLNSNVNNVNYALFDTCSGTEIQCGSGDEIYTSLSQGNNYVLRVSSRADLTQAGTFTVQAFQTINNDNCASASTIQIAGIGECATQNNSIDLRGATQATTIGSCFPQALEYYDAWYTFVAPITGNISVANTSVFDNYTLYDACNGNELVCFNDDGSLPVSVGNTYYLQVLKQSIYVENELAFCLEIAPTVATGTVDSCETLPDVTISTANGNTNEWVAILNATGNIVGAINANGNDLGVVSSTLFIDSDDTRISGSQPYMRREVSITPENQPTSNVMVRLYVLEDEMNDLITADANMINYLFLNTMKVSGSDCTTGYTGGGEFLDANSSIYGSDYYSEFSTGSFSVFYPTSTNLSGTLTTETFENNLGIIVYPTVSNGIINIKAEENIGKTEFSIFDLNGRLIQSSEIELGSSPIQIQLKKASKGIYFLKVEHNGSIETQKIIIK